MATEIVSGEEPGLLSQQDRAELGLLTTRVREHLGRTAEGILLIGGDLIRAKELLGHGHFGDWLDAEFTLSRRSVERFMAAARRFAGNDAVSHLPAGTVLELSAPGIPQELVDQVLSGQVSASVSAIRKERSEGQTDERSYSAGASFMENVGRFKGTSEDYAAGIAAQVLRGWAEAPNREWFADCLGRVAEMIRPTWRRRCQRSSCRGRPFGS